VGRIVIFLFVLLYNSCKLSKISSRSSNVQVRREVFPNRQIFKGFLIFDDQALFVGQMQQTNKAVACGDISQGLFWVDGL